MELALQLLAPVAGVLAVFAASAVVRLPRYVFRRARWISSRRSRDPDGLRPNSLTMAWSVLSALVLGVVLVGGFGYGTYWVLGEPKLPNTTAFSTTELFDLLKIALSVVAGFGGVVALTVAYRKQHVAEATHRLALKQEDREQGKLLYERFITASANLGEDKFPSRLAGVHTLAALADQSEELRQQCIDVLCGYLRTSLREDGRAEHEVRRAALTILLKWMGNKRVDLRAAEFRDVDLHQQPSTWAINFDGAAFTGEHTRFDEISFTGEASFVETRFEADYTTFRESWFEAVSFLGATFKGEVDFTLMRCPAGRMNFTQVDAVGATFDFTGAQVPNGVLNFGEADLTDASILLDPDKIEVRTTGAKLTGTYIGLPENAEAAQGHTP